MKVVILGGGVVGVTAAWYLAEDGHEVVVVDRHQKVGQETSFANAGYVAPGHCYAWASPRAPMTLLKSLFQEDAALKLRLNLDPKLWAWSLRFLANCTTARNRANTLVKLKLCLYSRELMIQLREQTGIAYDEEIKGALYLYRGQAELDTANANAAMLRDNGLDIDAVDADRVAEIEPALAHAKNRFAGAVYCAMDESGDCLMFTEKLMALAAEKGATFRGGVSVSALKAEGDRITGVVTDKGDIVGDAYMLSLGSFSPFAIKGLGQKLPIYPVKGYSQTVPAEGYGGTPSVPVLDEHSLIAFSRFGDRFRMTATADFAGYDTGFGPGDFTHMTRVARDLFPDGGNFDKPTHWACLRPMTPDGPPVLGRGRHRNLWYNTGQGHMGWTMACGSSRIVADLIAGRDPGHDLTGMEVGRF